MFLRIEEMEAKNFVGKRLQMSFANNHTKELWQSFMPRRKEIANVLDSDLYSIEEYETGFFSAFDATKAFYKWAAVEVSNLNQVPRDFETLVAPTGLYAVFLHKGPASEGERTYRFIFSEWLPASQYVVDQRPHFAVMGAKYKHDDPSSEEEIWIPVRLK
jgi:AraC family transcriptional regulator